MDQLQRTDAWYEVRLGKATASRFNDVLAKIKYGEAAARKNYRAQLVVERLTGQREEGFMTTAMQWGIDNEPIAKLAYMAETGNEVEEAFFVQHAALDAGASPDGYVDKNGLIEIKCPNTATHIETLREQDIPMHYYAQVQGQLWLTDRTWCDFVSFDPRMPANAQIFIKRIARNDTYIENLEKEITEFLKEVDAEFDFIQSYEG
jgi:putative phage-type endonuclease